MRCVRKVAIFLCFIDSRLNLERVGYGERIFASVLSVAAIVGILRLVSGA